MAVQLTPEQRAMQDRAMRQIYPEYGPYKDALAAGVPQEDAFDVACAAVAFASDKEDVSDA